MFTSQSRAEGPRESLEYRLQLLVEEGCVIAQDLVELLRVASSFAPPPVESHSFPTNPHRKRRLVPALMEACSVAALAVGNAIRNVAC